MSLDGEIRKIQSMCDIIIKQWETIIETNSLLSKQNILIVDHINVVIDLVKANIELDKSIADEVIKSQTAILKGFSRLGAGDLSHYVLKKKEDKPDGNRGDQKIPRDNEAEAEEPQTG